MRWTAAPQRDGGGNVSFSNRRECELNFPSFMLFGVSCLCISQVILNTTFRMLVQSNNRGFILVQNTNFSVRYTI